MSDPSPNPALLPWVVLASPDQAWMDGVRDALAAESNQSDAACCVDDPQRLGETSNQHIKVCALDEGWLGPVLALRRTGDPGKRWPELVVRMQGGGDERISAMVESGVRGCLPHDADEREWCRALNAVRAGEMWLSRRVFSAVLCRYQRQLNGAGDDEGLTQRQREIVACVARGMSNKQIARQLGISPTTVKTHLHTIYERVGVSGRTLLAMRAGARD